MKILILNWRDLWHPNAGGAEIVTHKHAKSWVQAGHEVTLFTAYYNNANSKEKREGIHFIRRGSPVFTVKLEALLWYLFEKHEKYDLVIDQFHGIPFFTPLYVRTKKLAFIHEVAKDVWKLNPWPKPFNLVPYVIGTIAEPWIFRTVYRTVLFLTVSESTKKDLEEWDIPAKNITIIHNGIHAPKHTAIPKKEKIKTIMFLGALSEDKGIKDAIQTFSLVHKKDPQTQFWIAGYGETNYVAELRQLCSDLGVLDAVTFWGHVDEKKKFALLAKAHLLINSSIREGWGLVIIEAARQGTPAVVYNVPGLRDSVKDNITGVVVKRRDNNIMAKEILSLLEDEKRYKLFQKNALAWAKSLTWEKATRKSLDLILSL